MKKKSPPARTRASRGTAVRKAPVPRPSSSSADTRLALMRAAERLMTDKGVDVVSLREVSAAAGQLNNSAVLYHFGSRDALIDAILERHSLPIHERWKSQLDFIERQGGVGLRPLVGMLVIEILDKLDDPDGGWEYISICGQLLMAPHAPLIERGVGNTETVRRLMGAMLPYHRVPPELLPLRFQRTLHLLYPSIIAWRRFESAGAAPVSRAVFASELIDSIVALIVDPLSPETSALLEASKEPEKGRRTRRARA